MKLCSSSVWPRRMSSGFGALQSLARLYSSLAHRLNTSVWHCYALKQDVLLYTEYTHSQLLQISTINHWLWMLFTFSPTLYMLHKNTTNKRKMHSDRLKCLRKILFLWKHKYYVRCLWPPLLPTYESTPAGDIYWHPHPSSPTSPSYGHTLLKTFFFTSTCNLKEWER